MVGLDEGALTCDFAETYHVLSWRALPASTAAALAMGLGPDSRIVQKISGAPAPVNTLLLAMIADALHVLVWMQTKDGRKGRNRPRSVLAQILGKKPAVEADSAAAFDSPEDFRAWRATMIKG